MRDQVEILELKTSRAPGGDEDGGDQMQHLGWVVKAPLFLTPAIRTPAPFRHCGAGFWIGATGSAADPWLAEATSATSARVTCGGSDDQVVNVGARSVTPARRHEFPAIAGDELAVTWCPKLHRSGQYRDAAHSGRSLSAALRCA